MFNNDQRVFARQEDGTWKVQVYLPEAFHNYDHAVLIPDNFFWIYIK